MFAVSEDEHEMENLEIHEIHETHPPLEVRRS